mmetsp:Transcript_26133/g.44456  ORF Transcript_26133/g.44456 Transcript_26133/m.44456 type:complete len:213 (+) Transcript_26133:3359-3997(+)
MSPNASNADKPYDGFGSSPTTSSRLAAATPPISASSCDFFSSENGTKSVSIAGVGNDCSEIAISGDASLTGDSVASLFDSISALFSTAKAVLSNPPKSSSFETTICSELSTSECGDRNASGAPGLSKSPKSSFSSSVVGDSKDFFSSKNGDVKGDSGRFSTSGNEPNGSDWDRLGKSEVIAGNSAWESVFSSISTISPSPPTPSNVPKLSST